VSLLPALNHEFLTTTSVGQTKTKCDVVHCSTHTTIPTDLAPNLAEHLAVAESQLHVKFDNHESQNGGSYPLTTIGSCILISSV